MKLTKFRTEVLRTLQDIGSGSVEDIAMQIDWPAYATFDLCPAILNALEAMDGERVLKRPEGMTRGQDGALRVPYGAGWRLPKWEPIDG